MDKQKVFVLKRCFRSLSFHANTRTGATNQLNDDDVAITVAQKEMLWCSMWLFFFIFFVTQLDCRLSSFFSRQTRNLQVQLCRKCVEVWQMLIAAKFCSTSTKWAHIDPISRHNSTENYSAWQTLTFAKRGSRVCYLHFLHGLHVHAAAESAPHQGGVQGVHQDDAAQGRRLRALHVS